MSSPAARRKVAGLYGPAFGSTDLDHGTAPDLARHDLLGQLRQIGYGRHCEANLNARVIMIAEKAADMIRSRSAPAPAAIARQDAALVQEIVSQRGF